MKPDSVISSFASSVRFMSLWRDRLVTLYGSGSVELHRFVMLSGSNVELGGLPFDFRHDSKLARAVPHQHLSTIGKSYEDSPGALSAHRDELIGGAYVMNQYNYAVSQHSCLVLPYDAVTTSKHSSASLPHATTDPVLFHCGYVDGGLRWTFCGARNPTAKPDMWVPRSASMGKGMADVCTLEGSVHFPGMLVTGHVDGRVCVWRVCKNSKFDVEDAWQQADGIWGMHGKAHAGAVFSQTSSFLVVGGNTDIILVLLASASPSSGTSGPVTALSMSNACEYLGVGYADGSIAAVSIGDGRVHRSWSIDSFRTKMYPTASGHTRIYVKNLVFTNAGYIISHWETVNSSSSILGAVYINGPIEQMHFHPVGPIKCTSGHVCCHHVEITSLAATSDGTTVLVGLSNGTVQVRHGKALHVGGSFQVSEELHEAIAGANEVATAVLQEAESAVAEKTRQELELQAKLQSDPNNVNNTQLTANIQAGLSLAKSTLGQAFAKLGKASNLYQLSEKWRYGDIATSVSAFGQGAATAESSAQFSHELCAVDPDLSALAVTSLLLVDEERALLVGTQDGRICLVTDKLISLTRPNFQNSIFGGN
jgi:hypothetical protein